ncbi:MAG: zinc ribbon domain-containing protein [bacterium]
MPIYEYQCPACGATFEKQQSITAAPIKTCPECGGRKVQRLISSTSFVLKGSGWYVTDYARKDGKGAKGSDAKESKESKSSSDAKSESSTKTESASETKTKDKSASTSSSTSTATPSS